MILLVDIGNTRIKWCIEDNKKLGAGVAIPHRQKDFMQTLTKQWLKLTTPDLLVIASVNNQICNKITNLTTTLWSNTKPILAKSTSSSYSVINSYQDPNKLGVDRWLGLIALRHYYPKTSCIVDCGTAITIDFLDNQGRHLGGLISPGIQLMKLSLYKENKDLASNNQLTTGLANTTESAITTGILYALSGFIEKTIANFSTSETLILTGGDANLLAQHIKTKPQLNLIIETDFVLKGLSLYCNEIHKNTKSKSNINS